MLAFQPVPDGPPTPPLKLPLREYLLWPYPFKKPLLELYEKEATPRILVVTDPNLSFDPDHVFGLSEFVKTLKATPVHGMLPIVTKAHRGTDAHADISSFRFDASVTTKKYDVIFLFGFGTATPGLPGNAGNLPPAEFDVVAKFMQDGGGLFATGDHENLGAAMSGNLPRVRAMRHWYTPASPSPTAATRISTNSPGANGVFEFDDQSDSIPQRIYPRYFQPSPTAFVSAPHAVLQAPALPNTGAAYQPIEFAPDHPHEGECVEPANLATIFAFGGRNHDEWPVVPGTTTRVAPQVAAYGVTYGGAFASHSKHAVRAPRSFGVIGTYDGHAADVGRVAVDSTWHHFVNINIDGTGTARTGLRETDPADPANLRDTAELTLIRRYWGNLANWLMPEHVRMRHVWGKLILAIRRPELHEELASWPKDAPRRKDDLALAGLAAMATSALAFASTPAEVEETLDDLTTLTLGRDALRALRSTTGAGDESGTFERNGARELQQAALAGTVLALNDLGEPGRDLAETIGAKGGVRALAELTAPAAREKAAHTLGELVKRTRTFEKHLAGLAKVVR